MEIREIDVADDDVMRAAYDVSQRSGRLGREAMPHWSLQEFLAAHRGHDSGERQEGFAVHEGEAMLGTCFMWFPLLDNLEKTWFDLHVDPGARRRGVGTALLDELERRARAEARTTLLTDSKIPADERETHGYRRFAEARGFVLSNVEVVRHLALPVPDERLQEWADHATERSAGYTVETFVDHVPDDLVESLCALMSLLAVDAPTGEADFEEETMTPERLRENYAIAEAMGRSVFETVALTPDRVVAAQSTLAVPRGEARDVYQWGTFVHREHRGHRLGLAVKVANIAAMQTAHPDKRLITTQNAETNGFMVGINIQLGFEPVEISAEWIRRL